MQRIDSISHPEGKVKILLDNVRQEMGMTPNFLTVLANAPAVLEAFLIFNKTMNSGKLSPQLREQLALTIAGYNKCNYCASAHTAMGSRTGIDSFELHCNLEGRSSNGKTQAALQLARALVEKRGKVDQETLQMVKLAGYTNEEIIEIVAHVGLNTFTNYFNEAIQSHIDFPYISTRKTRNVA